MSWFDTHCHLQSFLYKEELESVLLNATEMGVDKMVTVGTAIDDWSQYRKLAHDYPEQIYYTVGLHPGYVDGNWPKHTGKLEEYWKDDTRPVALGEIGLDYFRLPKKPADAEQVILWQKEAFRHQLCLAKKLDCPVIIHSRAAFDDCVEEIDHAGINWERIVFHCFTEGANEMVQLIERGGRGSFTGILTFPKNEALCEAFKLQGVDKLMLETDSPYLAPVPYRGKKNQPAYISELGKFANDLIGQNIENITWANALDFYQIG